MATIPAARDLAVLSRDALLAEAAAVRDATFGQRITWSPTVTISLTGVDHCGHCETAPLDPEQVLALAWRGATAGCHEALFTAAGPCDIDRAVAACQLVLDETGLLPRTEFAPSSADDLMLLRAVTPSQGLTLPDLRGDLAEAMAVVEMAGALRIPFTVRLLIGGGEDRVERLETLRLLSEANERHGHLQHVALQMASPAAEPAVLLETVALARLLLSEGVSLQIGPAHGAVGALLAAGIDDWGPIEPAHAEAVRLATEAHGFALVPRLAVRPAYARRPDEWIDPALHFAVLDRSDADGLARDDPGTVLPHRFAARTNRPIGPRSTAWYSGGDGRPPVLLPAAGVAGGAVREVLDGVLLGQEAGEDELVTLLGARGPEVAAVCEVADDLRRVAAGEVVTFVRNRIISDTTLEDVVERAVDAARQGATEVCLQGGIHPGFDGEYYLHLVQAVKAAAPGMHVHGFSALELFEGARRLGTPLEAYLRRLQAAGLGSLPGTAAEILDDDWLEVHRTAHRIGLRSNITMMFGTAETPRHWTRHLIRTRALQKETGGFTEFVPLPFVHMASPIYLERKARRGPTFREALLLHAVGRIAYRGVLDNVGGSWVKLGFPGMAQVLQAGVNDLGGTLMGEARAVDFERLVEPLGRPLEERTTLYGRP